MKKAAFILSALLLAGCLETTDKPDPGKATWERTEETKPDGSKSVKERAEFHAPQEDAKGSSFEFPGSDPPGTASGAFGGQWQSPKKDSKGSTWGQKALYASGILCFIFAAGFFYKTHFRLGRIAGLLGVLLIALAVTADKFPGLLASFLGIAVVLIGAVHGWTKWVEYKERNEAGLEP